MNFSEYLNESVEKADIVKMIFKSCQPYLKELRKERAKHFFYRGTDKLGGKHIMEVIPRQDRSPKDMPEDVHNYIDDYFYKKFRWRPRSEGVFVSYNENDARNYGKVCLFFPIGKYEYLFSPEVADLYSRIESNDDLVSAIENEEPPYYSVEQYESEWESEYGEGSGNGVYHYLGNSTEETDKDEAAMVAAEAEGIDPDEIDEDNLEWVPDIDVNSYIDQKWIEDSEGYISEFESTLNTYQKNKLSKAMTGTWEESEVMWKCKKYYIVDNEYEGDLIRELLLPNNKDFINTIERIDKQILLPFKWGRKK